MLRLILSTSVALAMLSRSHLTLVSTQLNRVFFSSGSLAYPDCFNWINAPAVRIGFNSSAWLKIIYFERFKTCVPYNQALCGGTPSFIGYEPPREFVNNELICLTLCSPCFASALYISVSTNRPLVRMLSKHCQKNVQRYSGSRLLHRPLYHQYCNFWREILRSL